MRNQTNERISRMIDIAKKGGASSGEILDLIKETVTVETPIVKMIDMLKKGGSSDDEILEFVEMTLADGTSNVSVEEVNTKGESPKDLIQEVTEILHQIGVPAHIKGYHYLRDSIEYAVIRPDVIHAVTKELYPYIAKKHETTSSRVERAIRHAIKVAWDRGDVDVLNAYFGYTIHVSRGKPTNSEFIAMISDKIRMERGLI